MTLPGRKTTNYLLINYLRVHDLDPTWWQNTNQQLPHI
jgi:hypothetical protein